jgi:glutamine synthetase
MSRSIIPVIEKIEKTMREEFQVEPRVGFEWEFQLLDENMEPVITGKHKGARKFNEVFGFLPSQSRDCINMLEDQYEKEHKDNGIAEISTIPLPPSQAAQALWDIQKQVAEIAKRRGWHFSCRPVPYLCSGTDCCVGLHVNSSLVQPKPPGSESLLVQNRRTGCVDSRAANAIHSLLRVNKETPLWSWHNEDDMKRLEKALDVFNSGEDKQGGVSIRRIESESDNGSDYVQVRLEERFPGSRCDPFVAAFRTSLGLYESLKNPQFEKDRMIDLYLRRWNGLTIRLNQEFNLGDIPETIEEMEKTHLPPDSVFRKYAGEGGFYGEKILDEIDRMAKRPRILDLENDRSGERDSLRRG